MAGGSLLTLLDDIATLLDDIASMSKVAVKQTAGVIGDDLAVNAEQVGNVRADREIPVVWAVAKGSFKNKLIIIPLMLLLSAFMPFLITPILVIGGAYLCFEGAEKIMHWLMHRGEKAHVERDTMLQHKDADLAQLEKDKIRGAIRTDFILSLEIIVIVLGSVQDAPFLTQCLVVLLVGLGVTVVVYGLVAGLVKLDDLGLHLLKKQKAVAAAMGRFLLWLAPALMKFLTIAGTIAMLLVGGGIITHSFESVFHHLPDLMFGAIEAGSWLEIVISVGMNTVVGMLLGLTLMGAWFVVSKFKPATKTISAS